MKILYSLSLQLTILSLIQKPFSLSLSLSHNQKQSRKCVVSN